MNTAEYVQTGLFKKFNECVVLSRNQQTSSSVDFAECLKMGQLIFKDVAVVSLPLQNAVASSNVRLSMALERPDQNNINSSFLHTEKTASAFRIETDTWKLFEEPNKAYLSSIGYVRVSQETKPPQPANPLFMVAALIVAFFYLNRMVDKDKSRKTDEAKK